MKDYKTIDGLMKALKRISESQSFTDLKGYDKLPDVKKEELMFLSGEISNGVAAYFDDED